MTFAITNFTINGNTHKYNNGGRNQVFLAGSIKQWDGARWNRLIIPGKAKERRITFSGSVFTDEEKTLLEALRVNTVFKDFNDGIITSGRWIVSDLTINFSVGENNRWNYSIIIEEFNQE